MKNVSLARRLAFSSNVVMHAPNQLSQLLDKKQMTVRAYLIMDKSHLPKLHGLHVVYEKKFTSNISNLKKQIFWEPSLAKLV